LDGVNRSRRAPLLSYTIKSRQKNTKTAARCLHGRTVSAEDEENRLLPVAGQDMVFDT
jgi:hypothetical protein